MQSFHVHGIYPEGNKKQIFPMHYKTPIQVYEDMYIFNKTGIKAGGIVNAPW